MQPSAALWPLPSLAQRTLLGALATLAVVILLDALAVHAIPWTPLPLAHRLWMIMDSAANATSAEHG